jgi:predicted acylesterase/phospholipase RssA/CRP-like cAMP-binding protein
VPNPPVRTSLVADQPTLEQKLQRLSFTRGLTDTGRASGDRMTSGALQAPVFPALEADLPALAAVLQRHRFHPWELLPADHLHIVVRGKVLVRRETSVRAQTHIGQSMGMLGLEGVFPQASPNKVAREYRAAAVVETLAASHDAIIALVRERPQLALFLTAQVRIQRRAEQIVTLLQRIPALSDARASDLHKLAEFGTLVDLKPGDVVGGEVDRDHFYLVLSGKVEVQRAPAEGAMPAVLEPMHDTGAWGFARAMAERAPGLGVAHSDATLLRIGRMAVSIAAIESPHLQRVLAQHPFFVNVVGLDPMMKAGLKGYERVLVVASPQMGERPSNLVLALAHQLHEDMGCRVLVIDRERNPENLGGLLASGGACDPVVVRNYAVASFFQDMLKIKAEAEACARDGNPFPILLSNGLQADQTHERDALFSLPGYTRVLYLHDQPEHWVDLPWNVATFPAQVVPVRLLSPSLAEQKRSAIRFRQGVVESGGVVEDNALPLDLVRVRLPSVLTDRASRNDGVMPVLDAATRSNLSRLGRAATGRRVGLALGGGGALCMIHLALLERLETAGVPVDIVAGTSFGSVVGAYWTVLSDTGGKAMNAEQVRARLLGDWVWPQITSSLAYMSTGAFKFWIDQALGRYDLEQLETSFLPACVDANDGRPFPVTRGLVGFGVRASGSFPPTGPTVHGGRRLLDGAPTANVPVYLAELAGAELIIASNGVARAEDLRNGQGRRLPFIGDLVDEFNWVQRLSDFGRVILMMMRGANDSQTLAADVVFDPAVHGFEATQFYKGKDIYLAGRNAPQLDMVAMRAAMLYRAMRLSASAPATAPNVLAATLTMGTGGPQLMQVEDLLEEV